MSEVMIEKWMDGANSVNKNSGSRDESEEEGWYARSDHPLLNDVVLSEVFEHVKPGDLKACREVCTKWNRSTIPITRSKWWVSIYGNPLDVVRRDTCYIHDDKKIRGIEAFIQVFELNRLGIPFAKFRLGSFCMTDGVGQTFLKLCGHLAKYIDLRSPCSTDHFNVEDVSELLKSVPNLVKFYIPRCLWSRSGMIVKLFPDDDPNPKLPFLKKLKSSWDYPEGRRYCPTFIEELLVAGKNISHLTLMTSWYEGAKCTSLEALRAIEKLGRESSIQTLKFSAMNEVPEHFELLSRMQSKGMKLKRLNNTQCFTNPLHFQVATTFKDTLVHYSHVLCTSFIGFPNMPHLQSLKLRSRKEFDSGCINLCKIFPALEKLIIEHCSEYTYDEFLSESEPCPKMKSLTIECGYMRLKQFTRTRTVFPNLTELNLHVNIDGVEILRNIWSGMTQLKVLKLTVDMQGVNDNERLDSIFTGISIRVMQEKKNLVKDVDKITSKKLQTEAIEEIINGTSQEWPSIRNLTNLSDLHLNVTGDCGDGNGEYGDNDFASLTNMTGYLSLYSMKHIRHLTVDYCQFSKTCCEILAADMKLQSWRFWTSNGVHIIPEMKAD